MSFPSPAQFNPYQTQYPPYGFGAPNQAPQQPQAAPFPPAGAQQSFTPQQAPQQPASAPAGGTVYQHPSGAIADKNTSLNEKEGGLLSKLFSFKGLMWTGGLAAVVATVGHFTNWFGYGSKTGETPEAQQPTQLDSSLPQEKKDALNALVRPAEAVDKVINADSKESLKAAKDALLEPFDKFTDTLEEVPQAALSGLKSTYEELAKAKKANLNDSKQEFKPAELREKIKQATATFQKDVLEALKKEPPAKPEAPADGAESDSESE